MKSAEAFVEALKKGISPEEALSSLTSIELRRCRVYMSFARASNRSEQSCRFRCRFHKNDLAKTPISRRFIFSSQGVFEAARRGHGLISTHVCRAFAEAVAIGYGGVWLRLTEEQYQSLRRLP